MELDKSVIHFVDRNVGPQPVENESAMEIIRDDLATKALKGIA